MDRVEERLKDLPHILHSKLFSCSKIRRQNLSLLYYVCKTLSPIEWYLGVDVHVLLQTDGVAKCLPANATTERSCSAV